MPVQITQSLRRTLFRRAALAGMACLCGVTVACAGKPAAERGPADPPPIPVKIEIARAAMLKDTTEYVATLKSRDSAVIMPQVDGQITQIFVHSGDRVEPGTALMQIDPLKQQASVKTQESSLASKRAELQWNQQQYGRVSSLAESGVASKQDLDQAKAALDASQAQLQALEAQLRQETVQLHYYKVVAPSAGIVGDIPVRVGDRVTPATTLTTVDQPGSLEAYVYIPIERTTQLKMGLPVQLFDSAGAVVAESKVTFVSPQVDNTTQTVLVKARIANNNDKLRTLQFIRARLIWGTHQGPVVPVLAVSRLAGQYFVFVAEDSKGKLVARQRELRVGDTIGNDYMVLDGIKPGDKVIVSGTQFLIDGAAVAPLG